jgi:hypothetical protein
MQHYEYIGEVLPGGQLPIAPSVAGKLIPGQKIRIKIEQISEAPKASEKKGELDAATLRLLQRMKNASRLGAIQGELRREEIYGDSHRWTKN